MFCPETVISLKNSNSNVMYGPASKSYTYAYLIFGLNRNYVNFLLEIEHIIL